VIGCAGSPDVSIPTHDPACETKRLLRVELTTLFYGSQPVVLFASVTVASLFTLWLTVSAGRSMLLIAWWIAQLLLSVVRGMLWARFRAGAAPPVKLSWASLGVAGAGANGVLWGLAGAIFFRPNDPTQYFVLGFILAGMGAGALSALNPSFVAFAAYLVPSVLPFAVRLMLAGRPEHLATAAMSLFYVACMLLVGRHTYATLVRSLLLRFEHAELARTLESRVAERTEQLRQMNEQLTRDLALRQAAEDKLAEYGRRQTDAARFGQRALSVTDLDTLFEEAAQIVACGMRASRAAVWLARGAKGDLQLAAAAGRAEHLPAFASTILADSGAPQILAMRGRDVAACADLVAQEQLCMLDEPDEPRLRSTVNVPLVRGEREPFGVIEASADQPGWFSEGDVAFLRSIATILAAAIARCRAEADIERMALQDPLTGLTNRTLFRQHLLQGLARSRRSGRALALLMIDLDRFKDVNDTMGHPTGDTLLTMVAARLKAAVRASESPARLGGDEFAVILEDLRSAEDAAVVARKIIECLSQPIPLQGEEVRLGASIGVAVHPADGEDPDLLLRNADLALYRAKAEGGDTVSFYAAELSARIEQRKLLEADLRRALSVGGLQLCYQPVFDVASRQMIGVEALVRWHHPSRGLLLPADFLEMAESSGLIGALDLWVAEEACSAMQGWRAMGPWPLRLSVNISLARCRRQDWPQAALQLAGRYGSSLHDLGFEIPEGAFSREECARCAETLERLRSAGAAVIVDHFGLGYSCLGRLPSLPVDWLKIDQRIIASLAPGNSEALAVRGIVGLARSLGHGVIAVGVESRRQQELLVQEGCRVMQGAHLAPPLSADDFTAMLAGLRGDAPAVHA